MGVGMGVMVGMGSVGLVLVASIVGCGVGVPGLGSVPAVSVPEGTPGEVVDGGRLGTGVELGVVPAVGVATGVFVGVSEVGVSLSEVGTGREVSSSVGPLVGLKSDVHPTKRTRTNMIMAAVG